MLLYQKTMFDHYYCIKTFFRLKTLEKFEIKALKSMLPVNVLKMPLRGQRLTSSTGHFTDYDVSFYKTL